MKKLLSIALVLALLGAMSVLASAEGDITGTWYCNIIRAQGMEMDPSMMEMEVTLTVNADGTASVESGDGSTAEGTWSDNGDGTYAFDIEGEFTVTIDEEGSLVMGNAEIGMEMVFGRERVVSAGYEEVPTVAANDITEFNGTWNGVSVVYSGVEMPITTIDAYFNLVITDGTIEVSQGDLGLDDNTTTFTDMTNTLTGSLADGKLVVEDGSVLSLSLHEDGTLTNDTEMLVIIFEKAE